MTLIKSWMCAHYSRENWFQPNQYLTLMKNLLHMAKRTFQPKQLYCGNYKFQVISTGRLTCFEFDPALKFGHFGINFFLGWCNLQGGFKLFLSIFSTKMKNDWQPIRDSIPWNSCCTKDPCWLNNVFLFSIIIRAEQLKQSPCTIWVLVRGTMCLPW